jgi:hypothetical protein
MGPDLSRDTGLRPILSGIPARRIQQDFVLRDCRFSGTLPGLMAAKAKKELQESDLLCLKLAREVTPFCRALDRDRNLHGNAILTLQDALVVTLAVFFNPPAQSL